MATPSERLRTGELGLSIIEALVIVVITALIAALLMPLVSKSTQRNWGMAESSLDAVALAGAEGSFRSLLGGVDQPIAGSGVAALDGQASIMQFVADVAEDTACGRPGSVRTVRLKIVNGRRGGRLVCDGPDGDVEMARWRDGSATFSYSTDGVSWSGAATRPVEVGAVGVSYVAPLARFTLSIPRRAPLVWVEKVGWSEARNRDRPEATQRTPR